MILVAGAGGFIGGHLVRRLIAQDRDVVAVDSKPLAEWQQLHTAAENVVLDLREIGHCRMACEGASEVYNLAASMGGMGYIESHKTECMLNVLINTHLLEAAREEGVSRYFFASSACVYSAAHQEKERLHPLAEHEAYPAMPEDGYGWEKLFSERMCRHFHDDGLLETRVARFHNIYGPLGTWEGGREKAPAALCRKVARAKLLGEDSLEVWGDGQQMRSFTYVDDCVEGMLKIMAGPSPEPVNLGSDEVVSIDRLVDLVEEVAGTRLARYYVLSAPRGVRWRNSDNTRLRRVYDFAPTTSLREGLARTYPWVEEQVRMSLA